MRFYQCESKCEWLILVKDAPMVSDLAPFLGDTFRNGHQNATHPHAVTRTCLILWNGNVHAAYDPRQRLLRANTDRIRERSTQPKQN